jgi:Uncharacterized conserved protein
MVAAGTPVEPEPGLSRNMLMSAMTGGDISDIDCPSEPFAIQAGDKVLVCSDGVNTLSRGKIIQYCDWSETPEECVEALLNAVEDAEIPKQDNATTVVINIVDLAIAAVSKAPSAVETEEDIEAIDTEGRSKAATVDLEKPADKVLEEEIEARAIPEPMPRTITEPELEKEPDTGKKPGGILIISIAASIVVAVIIGAYFMTIRGKAPAPDATTTEFTSEEPAQTLTEPEPGVTQDEVSETAETPEREAETAESKEAEPPATPVTAEESKPETAQPAVEQAVSRIEEFQDTLKDRGMGPVMIWIPAGSFLMGSPGTSISNEERPQHRVKVKRFAISKYEITFADYDKYVAATGHSAPDDLYMEHMTTPVFLVKWDDAYNYAKWLSQQTGQKYRLPSEAEWEYAASGGQNSPFWWGFSEEPGKAHCFTCDSKFDPRKPTKIGAFPQNQFGLHDTAGNVAEWVYDCWHDNYTGAPADGSVWEGGGCSQRIARGGSYISPQQSIRTAKRDKFKSDSGYDHIGFRLVREE